MDKFKQIRQYHEKISQLVDYSCLNLGMFIKQNAYLIVCLLVIVFVVYGFELFNFNLTIDEEVHATFNKPTVDWLKQGRWGMYILNMLLLPYSVIPFVPLFLALSFHILAILLLVTIWGDYSKIEKIIIGSICLAYPGIAYVYTFSTINYGIGFGFLCCVLSLWLFVRLKGGKSFFAIFPAAFAISIYQGMIPSLIAVFLIYFINLLLKNDSHISRDIGKFIVVLITALLFSQAIQVMVTNITGISESSYVSGYFDYRGLKKNILPVLQKLMQMMTKVYSGDETIYSLEISLLGIVLIVSTLGFLIKLAVSKTNNLNKLLAFLFWAAVVVIPFLGGILMNGYYAMRFLVALSFVIPGLIALTLDVNSSPYKLIIIILVAFCVLQFAQSTNHLFGSSYLALQNDRLLGERLIDHIDKAIDVSNGQETVKYLELVGYYDFPDSYLIPETETIGASFYEWDEGNIWRVLMFFNTLGYDKLTALPTIQRISVIETANAMPQWPAEGSVKVVDDTVILKFGPYSNSQKESICIALLDHSEFYKDLENCEESIFKQ